MARQLAGRYHLESLISSGGKGAVWRATDRTLNREVAVKLLALDEGVASGAAERLEHEAQIAASFHHPNVATVFDYGIDDSTAFIVTALLAAPSLTERTENDVRWGSGRHSRSPTRSARRSARPAT